MAERDIAKRVSGNEVDNPPLFRFGRQVLVNSPWQLGCFGIGASGGMFSSVPTLRRMAFAVARHSPTVRFDLQFGVKGALPGPIQTAPRVEFYVIFQVVQNGSQGGRCLVYSDSEVDKKLHSKGRDKCLGSVKCDLRIEFPA